MANPQCNYLTVMQKQMGVATIIASAFLVLLVAGIPVRASGDFWVSKAPMLHALGQFTGRATVLGDKIYAVTTAPNQSASGRAIIGYLETYSPISNLWEEESIVPANIASYAVTASGGKIYVIGTTTDSGGTATYFNAAYDPVTNTWENKSASTQVLADMQANVVDGKIYIISGGQWHGFGNFAATKTNYVYDPSVDSWSEKTPIPTPVAFYSSAVVDNKIYVMGGQSQYVYPSTVTTVDIVQIYDPATNSWAQGSPLPSLLASAAACSTTGAIAEQRIYVVGGINYSDPTKPKLNTTLIYDAKTGNWSTGASMLTQRWGLSLVNVNDTLYALGGVQDGNWLTTNEAYTPADYGVTALPSPSPTQTPAGSDSQSPTQSPTPSPSPTQQATQEPTPTWTDFVDAPDLLPVLSGTIIMSAVGALGVLIYIKKGKKQQ